MLHMRTRVIRYVAREFTVEMRWVIGQKGFDELAETEIQKERAAIRSRARTHFRYLQVRQHAYNLVHGKILPHKSKTKAGSAFGLVPPHAPDLRQYRHQRHRS